MTHTSVYGGLINNRRHALAHGNNKKAFLVYLGTVFPVSQIFLYKVSAIHKKEACSDSQPPGLPGIFLVKHLLLQMLNFIND